MYLSSLQIDRLRNLTGVRLRLHPRFNVFFGENGSGKTSVLEGIHHLSLGRSFRARGTRTIIQHDQAQLTVFGEIETSDAGGLTLPVGVARSRSGQRQLKSGGGVAKPSVLASQLPLQVIFSDTLRSLVSEPQWRRRFLDWGAFHVEPGFHAAWQAYQAGLKQRNGALRSLLSPDYDAILAWDKGLAAQGEWMDQSRAAYVSAFVPVFQSIWAAVMGDMPIALLYERGWPVGQSLLDVLQRGWAQDVQWGYTRSGAHRVDWRAQVKGEPAHAILSQGQRKLLVYALMLTQALLLQERYQKPSVLLLDDLPAELDKDNRGRVMAVMTRLKGQVFVTGVHRQDLADTFSGRVAEEIAWFHVKQGGVIPVSSA